MKISHLAISLVCVFAASNLFILANEKFEAIAVDFGFGGYFLSC
ncbi:hypothetical protein IWQ48_000519 [Labrenzia sp. EL_13]|nr:hypothetical protein [Labrenzia sp. EL_13]